MGSDVLSAEIQGLGEEVVNPESLLGEDEVPRVGKYDRFVPGELLRKAFAIDELDPSELRLLATANYGNVT